MNNARTRCSLLPRPRAKCECPDVIGDNGTLKRIASGRAIVFTLQRAMDFMGLPLLDRDHSERPDACSGLRSSSSSFIRGSGELASHLPPSTSVSISNLATPCAAQKGTNQP